MKKERHNYRAYLLRCWREISEETGVEGRWNFSLEEILYKRRRKGFTSLEALVDFLKAELIEGEDSPNVDEE